MRGGLYKGLVAFDSGAKLPAGELPSRINVAPWGTHDTAKGKIIIGDVTAKQLPLAQKASNFDRVALDFNHNTVPGSEAYRGEPAAVAAHGTPSIVPGEGIILDKLDWTPEGTAAVQNRHYPDLSPTLQLNANGEAVFLHSAALCRQGAIPGLSLFSGGGMDRASQPLENEGRYFHDDQLRELLCTVLGLDATSASDEEIEAAAMRLAGLQEKDANGDVIPLSGQLTNRAITVLCARKGLDTRGLALMHAVADAGEQAMESAIYRKLGISADEASKYQVDAGGEDEGAIFRKLGLTAADVKKHLPGD